ncbi:MAG: hypothetical protein LT067_06390 [Sulfurovum sp.]|nr:hypothetical protein [Sulfurovum sp.]
MKTITKIITATSAALFVTGCVPKLPTVPMATSNIDDYKTIQGTNTKKSHLFIHTDTQHPININIDNKVFDSLAHETYAYYELTPGRHWIAAMGYENSSFMCKQFQPNQRYIYEADMSMGLAAQRVHLKESSVSEISKDNKQILQKNKKVSIPLDGSAISSISVVGSGDKNIETLTSKVQQRLEGLSISSGNGMIIKLSLLSQQEGSQLGRWIFGGMSAAEDHKSSLITKAEFYIGNKKVDELISQKEIIGGLFGGSNDSLTSLIADEITSYLACKYYGQQYPSNTK